MPIFNSIITLSFSRRKREIEFFKKNPAEAQEKQFKKLIKKAAQTEWGRLYNYSNIKTVTEFRQQVPLQSYEDLWPYIERMQTGETNILWPGEVNKFAKSSGTTSAKSKFIPVSDEALKHCHYRGGKDVIYFYRKSCPNSLLFRGKTLSLGGTQQKSEHDIYCGDLSAILMSNLPLWVQLVRAPNLETALILMGEWEDKIDKIISATKKRNITCLTGVPSWMLVLLRQLLEKTGKNSVSEVWPGLELFIHGGISFEPYREQFKKIIPSDKMNYLEVYNASEGFFAVNEHPGADDMLLMLDYGVFYEFIPMEEFDKPNPKTLGINEVELGKNYALVISTNGGLWRYSIGDTIKFTSLTPHRIKVSGRTKHYINAFGEELMVGNTDKALEITCSKTGASIKDYTAAPVFMSEKTKGCHQWLIEFDQEPEDFDRFCYLLDQSLQSLNSDYEAKRYKDITLGPPDITKVRSNLFYDWLKQKNKLGGQNKVPRLANNREYIDELLELL